MHIWFVVPTNDISRSSKPRTEEQKEVRRARNRLNYAKNIQSKKGLGKISMVVVQSSFEYCHQ
jgi:hypothetical protein